MIDYLLTFPDEATAITALSGFWAPSETEGSPGVWNGSSCIPNVSVYAITGTQTVTDPETNEQYEQEVRSVFPGWHIWVTLNELNADLTAMPGCRIAADYEVWESIADGWTWDGDRSWLVYIASDLSEEVMKAAHIEPQFGREKPYPFGI